MKFPRARGRQFKGRERGKMNKQEQEYYGMLQHCLPDSEKHEAIYFEAITLQIAPETRYTPDFMVMRKDGTIELHEVKGWMEEAAFVRLKVAADKFPMFRFVLAKKRLVRDGGGWDVREVGEPGTLPA